MNQAKPNIRLYVPDFLAAGEAVTLTQQQSHYVSHVMRCHAGDSIALFNGQDGEWQAVIDTIGKKTVTLRAMARLRMQKTSPDVWLAFAPIKNKTDMVVEKAVELGVSALLPVITRRAVVRSVNEEKLAAHAIEAAEQCERLDVPRLAPYADLGALLAVWPKDRLLLYGDESGGGAPIKTVLHALREESEYRNYAVLVGPEGGFAPEEHALLKAAPCVRAFGMGPRILRADTAAVAALACVQAWLGDWEERPEWTY